MNNELTKMLDVMMDNAKEIQRLETTLYIMGPADVFVRFGEKEYLISDLIALKKSEQHNLREIFISIMSHFIG